jgi:hypothetical protein
MAMKRKRDDLKEIGMERSSDKQQTSSEKQLHAVAKTALKKADRFWRLAEKAPTENYREHHMKQARAASEVAAEKTRQAHEIRSKANEKA